MVYYRGRVVRWDMDARAINGFDCVSMMVERELNFGYIKYTFSGTEKGPFRSELGLGSLMCFFPQMYPVTSIWIATSQWLMNLYLNMKTTTLQSV